MASDTVPAGPLPGVGPGVATRRVWSQPYTFAGRASRSEFWWWWLVTAAVGVVLVVVLPAVTGTLGPVQVFFGPLAAGVRSAETGPITGEWSWIGLIYLLWSVVTLIPTIAVAVRRLHDADLSGAWLLLGIFPLVGIAVTVLLARGSRAGGARFDRVAAAG
jgi:uncharacterized membrane protein YhaH (DUF805 family)